MTMLHKIQHHTSQVISASLRLCVLILQDTCCPHWTPLLKSIWSVQETADLINYLYQCRDDISEGSFPPGAFSDLAGYLNKRYPGSDRSRNLVLFRFAFVRAFQLIRRPVY